MKLAGNPMISVLMETAEDSPGLSEAIRSVLKQTYAGWELIIATVPRVNDALGSIPGLSGVDPRIKVVNVPNETSPAARLNQAAWVATGERIAYLGASEEFFPEYLERIAAVAPKIGVVVCGCDVMVPGANGAPAYVSWSPATIRSQLFARNICSRFGIAHTRELSEQAGGFNELCGGAEWDLLKRFARLGAEFVFPDFKAGKCRAEVLGIAGGDAKAEGRGKGPTDWQKVRIDQNRRERKPIWGVQSGWTRPKRAERILFVCAQCVLDYTNGASLAVLHALRWLNANGLSASAFCVCEHTDPEQDHARALEQWAQPTQRTPGTLTNSSADGVWRAIAAGIPVTVRHVERNDPWRVTGDMRKFLGVYERLLNEQRPDVVVTYGGDCLSLALMEATKFRDIPVVFWLHNFNYPAREVFQFADRVIVPSDFSRDYHWKLLGLDCHTLPNFIDWPRVQVERRKPQYVTFVNPGPYKGAFVFAAIAERLATVRPEIPLLVVEGRTSPESLRSMGLDLARFPNVKFMRATADPREFYSMTKLLLMPSLWNESFGLVAVEAMINGIPVLASNRGALPEIVGDSGDLFDIPAQYTPDTRIVPAAAEIEPWVDRIIALWDEPAAYVEASQRAHYRAETWRPERLGPSYGDFFANISPHPAPPIVF